MFMAAHFYEPPTDFMGGDFKGNGNSFHADARRQDVIGGYEARTKQRAV